MSRRPIRQGRARQGAGTGNADLQRSQDRSPFRDQRLTIAASLALIRATSRYWLSIAPLVRKHLRHWERRAHTIDDPVLRALALEKLGEERFNAELAAMLATLAPRSHRQRVVAAIVALEVMYDYLDGLTESPSPEPLRDGAQLFTAFTDAFAPSLELEPNYYRFHPQSADGAYLEELVATVRSALAQLPAAAAIAEAAWKCAARCAEAQTRAHAAPSIGAVQLEDWAAREAAATELQPREFLAGAEASVLALHALIAAAAEARTTPAHALELDSVYLSISALTTMLDSVVDYQVDLSIGRPGYVQHYESGKLLAQELAQVARKAATGARSLPNGAHHVMLLVGVVAYYISAPAARSDFARPVSAHIESELRPLIGPTLAVMNTWRGAKRLRQRLRATRAASWTVYRR